VRDHLGHTYLNACKFIRWGLLAEGGGVTHSLSPALMVWFGSPKKPPTHNTNPPKIWMRLCAAKSRFKSSVFRHRRCHWRSSHGPGAPLWLSLPPPPPPRGPGAKAWDALEAQLKRQPPGSVWDGAFYFTEK